ncbi:Encodes a chloroplast protein that induces tolerance to multiple environmental stresses and reduces photooxidative damage [Striga hermonthica]|uniref:Encodes a chloroplast protein that induces tolerance to multiple environmental stresses and reduces photooxidative damage n=1 Tax=Striga hermonthica TaxID=68872 RepID=A0A9N7N7T7_STRHE|nr:Encodes a chloroplast protein that induces tolerance to multiple environmental stresses and reduces photooxidative damage [Striga hermonthica]
MGVSGLLQPHPVAVSSLVHLRRCSSPRLNVPGRRHIKGRTSGLVVLINKGEAPSTSTPSFTCTPTQVEAEADNDQDPQDLEYVAQIKRVLELLRKNRDMFFNEVKLTIMIEDPRDVERRRMLGIDDEDAPTRDDLADALVQVNEGQIPENRAALRMLAEELLQWPNLEVEATKKKQPGKSLYAKVTDTGVDPQEAAKRLNIDWDSAAEIGEAETVDDVEVPSVVGYGALYLVTAFPVIIVERVPPKCVTMPRETHAYNRPHASSFMEKKDSEKQISVDPISLAMREIESSLSRQTTSTKAHAISYSLTNSPRIGSIFIAKHKSKSKTTQNPQYLGRQHSVALTNLERLRETHMRRSKSCGEGRSCRPSIDFDLWSTNNQHLIKIHHQTHEKEESDEEEEEREKGRGSGKFVCGACLFIPGFGKGKAVRAQKEEVTESDIVSQRMSLEKFECGSWRSSTLINYVEGHGDDDPTSNLFFDLPIELIRCSNVNDTESPVTTGFVFDDKGHHHRNHKGVLKIGRKIDESRNSSRRHVRFSTSSTTACPVSPTSPNLRKARDELSAFLEAQST